MDVDPGRRRVRRTWRLLTPLGFIAAGVLMVTSAVTSGGTDLRPGRYEDLADLARTETQRVQALRAHATELNGEISQLSREVKGPALTEAQRQASALKGPAGLTAVEGPGVTVTLQDAPKAVQESAGTQVANAIVHQQDIQAVANAMWVGGAEAMTIQGQRVVSTTGIKCVGNTVLLHGVTYSPPYVISAIGDVASMRVSISTNPYIRAYLQAVREWQLGWDLQTEDRISAPAFDGPTELSYAHAASGS
ncbi:MAG: hypothetical protein QOK15_3403 [Nocardioidaceae bacterium]|nr:hypothetical protein [Nocardioidaceae bacterium]